MIGNDVVDIIAARAENNWQRPGFLQKLFTAYEQRIILSCNDPEIMVWTLWSMKEAAYKIYNRETGTRAFIPHLIECSLNTLDYSGLACIYDKYYYTKTTIEDLIIDTVAVVDLHYFAQVKAVEIDRVLKDKAGLPYIALPQSFPIPVSVSNHGRCTKAVYLN